jgi:hypothetical protein
MKTPLVRSLLTLLFLPALAWAAPAAKPFPASATPLPAPVRPASTRSYWSTATAKNTKEGVTVTDAAGHADLSFPGWLTLEPNVGFTLSGEQTAPLRLANRELVTPHILIGVDLKPAAMGNVEYQTFIYLYGYCELRYRASKGELTFNVWQGGPKAAGAVTLPIVPGKWNRVQAQIDGTVVRLTVNGVVQEASIGAEWTSAATAPVLLGSSGAERPFMGGFNHLYIAEKP